ALCAVADQRLNVRRVLTGVTAAAMVVGLLANFYRYYWSDILFSDQLTGEMNIPIEDYLPKGTLSEWYATDTGDFSDYENVAAFSYTKNYTSIDCTYTAKTDGEYMEFPLFYYKGYQAFDQDKMPLVTEKGGHNRVRVYLTRSEEIRELHLHFEVERIYTVLFVFSILFTVIWSVYELLRILRRPDEPDSV
ncbi:MAG: hypothetical protein IJT16_14530, partial [Lachnospiraceae bacterium]|nr:hypothetical protein [Lachnospiraceae bacterium]